MSKRQSAREAARERAKGDFWLDHVELVGADNEWLSEAEKLTLWNVRMPASFLAGLPKLWWLDLRGGTAPDLAITRSCRGLRCLQVNQVRGMVDLGMLTEHMSLQLLSLYGLASAAIVPSLLPLNRLLRLEVGQMRSLPALDGLLDAPNLRELYLHKQVGVSEADIRNILGHRSLRQFCWNAEGVPARVSEPVRRRIGLPESSAMHPNEWFDGLLNEART